MAKSSDKSAESRAQGTLGYSQWDRIPQGFYRRRKDGLSHQAANFRARTGFVSEAVAEPSAARYKTVAAELSLRQAAMRKLWIMYSPPKSLRRRIGDWIGNILVLGWIGLAAVGVVMSPRWYYDLAWLGFLLLVFLAVYRLGHGGRPVATKNPLELFVDNRCVDCEQSLVGVPDAIDPTKISGLHVGPAECPECGGKWPRVPAFVTSDQG